MLHIIYDIKKITRSAKLGNLALLVTNKNEGSSINANTFDTYNRTEKSSWEFRIFKTSSFSGLKNV